MERTNTLFLTFHDIIDFVFLGDIYDSYFFEEIPRLFKLLPTYEYNAHMEEIHKINESINTFLKTGGDRDVGRDVLIVFPTIYADNVRSALMSSRQKNVEKVINTIRDSVCLFIDELNNKNIEDREDIITDAVIKLQTRCQKYQNCLTVGICNSIDKMVAKEINAILERNDWNFERNNFFRKPDAKKLAIDVKNVENYYSIPKIAIYEDEYLAKNVLRIINAERNGSRSGSRLEFARTTRVELLPFQSEHINEPITQALFRSYIKYGCYDSNINYNKEFFAIDMQFIRENYIKKRSASIDLPLFHVIEKLDKDDPIIDVINNLISSLRKDSMGSSLTPYIQEYEGLVCDFQANEKQVCMMVALMLRKHGWSGKDKGFLTEPNRKELVVDLEKVVKPYTSSL